MTKLELSRACSAFALGLLLALCAAAPDAEARKKDKGPACAKADQRLATLGAELDAVLAEKESLELEWLQAAEVLE